MRPVAILSAPAAIAGMVTALTLSTAVVIAAPAPSLANPAAVFCADRGGRVEVERAVNGGQKGICVLSDGTRVDEWVYFRNAHRTTH